MHQEPTLKQVVKKTIIKALVKNDGHVSKAAQELGISRTGIYFKMDKYSINPKEYRKSYQAPTEA